MMKFHETQDNDRIAADGEQVYQEHNELVRRLARNREFLEYNVKEGWEPLCKFLDKPVPRDEPFPRLNETAVFQTRLKSLKRLIFLGYVINILKYTGAALIAGYAMYVALGRSL